MRSLIGGWAKSNSHGFKALSLFPSSLVYFGDEPTNSPRWSTLEDSTGAGGLGGLGGRGPRSSWCSACSSGKKMQEA